MSNDPPAFTLDLSDEEAQFLMNNCQANISHGLNHLQALDLDPYATDQSFKVTQQFLQKFTHMRDRLRKLGVPEPD